MPETEKFKEVVVAECVIYLKVYLKQAEFLIHGKSPGATVAWTLLGQLKHSKPGQSFSKTSVTKHSDVEDANTLKAKTRFSKN